MIKVGLIDPGTKKLTSMPHTGLAYIAAALQQSGHTASILDMGVSTKEEIDAFFASPFDLVGVTATSFSFCNAVEVTGQYRKVNPRVPIVLGGPHVTIALDNILDWKDIDFAVYGEGEKTIVELATLLESGLPYDHDDYGNILGLVRRKDGRTVVNPPRPWNRALDELPFPAYHSLPMERYEIQPLITSRGCPYKCTYCAAHVLCGGIWRGRSAENLLAEVQYLQANWGSRTVAICDDNFNVRVDRVRMFCEALIENGIQMEWQCWGFRADRADLDMLKAMRASGCNCIAMGLESANPQVLKNIRKNETLEEIATGIRNIMRAGIACQTMNMIGNQGDSLETIKETIAFNRRMKVDEAAFYLAIPYPKTQLWDYVESHGRFLKPDYTQFHHFSDEPIFETDDFTKEQRMQAYRLARKFELEMRLRLAFRRKLQRIRQNGWKGIGPAHFYRAAAHLGRLAFNLVFVRKQRV